MVWSKEKQEVVKKIRVVAGHISDNAEKHKKTGKITGADRGRTSSSWSGRASPVGDIHTYT